MSIFIQEVLGLLKRNQKKITLDKSRDWFEFGKLYQTSVLNTGASYNPKMDPFVIKWGDLVCQATEDLTRTLPGQGNLGFVPVYTDPSGYCSWDTLKDSIITQNALNTIINIAGNLVVAGDLAVNGCDLTSTCIAFNLLNQPTTITFGSGAANIFIGRADPTSTVTIVGTQDSNACTNGALVVNGGVGIAKNLNVCGIVSISNTTQSTSCTTGALVVAGGVGIAKDLFVCGNATITGDAAINGGDLTSTASNFNLLQQSSTIGFGYTSQLIAMGGISATSTVLINGTQDSTSCTTGALRISGGVGIAKNLFVCGTSNLNGYVFLGDTISDEIALNGTLLDNNGTPSAINQALVGTGTGAATWQNVALVGQVCAVNSIPLWTPNSSTLGCSLIYQNGNSSTPATKIFFQGGLASEGSQVRTITDIALGMSNYAGGEASAAFGFRTLALGGDSFACGHKGFAGGHGSLAAGYNTGAGNHGFGLFVNTITSSTLTINILSGTIAVGDFIIANVDIDPSIRYEILTLVGTGTIGLNTITIATPISVDTNEAVAIEEAVPNRGDSQGAIAFGYNAASKGIGAIAIGSLATTDISNQIAIGSGYTTVKLGGTYQDNTLNKILVLDANEVVRWRDASTITPVTANNGLTMSTASNVQLGGTLIQNTTINNANFDFIVSRNNSGTTIQGLNSSIGIGVLGTSASNRGVLGTSVSGVGVEGASESFVAARFRTSPVSNNTVTENTSLHRSVLANAPGNNGIGQSLVFANANSTGAVANANTLISKWTNASAAIPTSEFSITGVNAGVTGNKLILSGNGSLNLPEYGAGIHGGTAVYNLSVTSTGDVIETSISAAPKVFVALINQSGVVAPTMTVVSDFSSGAVTFTWSYVSPGLYTLQASQPVFLGPKTAFYITPDVNTGKSYCAAIERQTDTLLLVNCFFPTTGVSEDNFFDKATLKIEMYP